MNNEEPVLIWVIIVAFISLVILYVIIEYATSTGKQLKNQRAMIRLLEKIAEKNGVSKEEIAGIRGENNIK